MKKRISLIALMLMLCFASMLVACGGSQTLQGSSAVTSKQGSDSAPSSQSASSMVSEESTEASASSEANKQPTTGQLASPSSENATVGNHVGFGRYEQDGNDTNGSEEIEWRVLAVEDGKALLLSEYAIDAHSFDSEDDDWETSDLREWLNSSLLNEAFSLEEQSRIEGELFCLSNDEADSYFSNDASRICKATPYSSKRIIVSSDGGYPWWLRSPGNNKGFNGYIEGDFIGLIASCVDYDGEISPGGPYGSLAEIGIRPAMWVRF